VRWRSELSTRWRRPSLRPNCSNREDKIREPKAVVLAVECCK
jgi:hypothetical protein